MHLKVTPSVLALLGLLVALTALAPTPAMADDIDPPTRVARLAFVEGSVAFQPGGTDDWVAASLNRPLTTGDQLWSDRDSRVELQLDGSLLRLGSATSVSFLNLSDEVTQIQLTAGTLLVRVRRLDDNETYEIDTPNLAFSILRPGIYRITVDDSGTTTAIRVRSGQGEVTGGGAAYAVHASEDDVFSGTDELAETARNWDPQEDPFDKWSSSRDRRWEHSVSAQYVSPDIVGYEDLDDQGTWNSTSDYGYVWFPQVVEVGWAPYHSGHWSYVEPWGYTWIDDQPWGFAPFHYGRWVSVEGRWGWIPAPPRLEGAVYVRPVYAPALVAWVGAGASIAWFALGPREVYVPSYPVSRAYVMNINLSNTHVNATFVTNIYNTTIINKTVNVTNVTYVNRGVPGAITVTTPQAFTTAQPVARNLVRVDVRDIASAPVRVLTPAEVPSRQAVLGAGRVAAARPPAALQTRAVVARTAPPPPPPSFERRQEAIRTNGGNPLSVAQLRQIAPSSAPRAAAVRVAPPARADSSVSSSSPPSAPPRALEAPRQTPAAPRGADPVTEPGRSPEVPRPPAEASRPALSVPAHPQESPAPPGPVSPSVANSALERQHLQEQQRLQAQQEQERREVQQRQALEHQQELAKQQADQARQQELERQHQQQTQALLQKHAQEQQQLQAIQEQQRRQASSKPAPKNSKEEERAP